MAEYIEREAAFNALLKLIPKVDDDGYCWVIRGDAATAIDSIPAADVRPVVLCRDCTFFKPQQKSKRWSSTTPMCSRSATIKMPPDGFCSFGVKREKN